MIRQKDKARFPMYVEKHLLESIKEIAHENDLSTNKLVNMSLALGLRLMKEHGVSILFQQDTIQVSNQTINQVDQVAS